MKEHTAHWRKGEETLLKWLKEGNDTRGFAIEGKGKGRSKKKKNLEKKKGRRGKYSEGEQHAPSKPSYSKEEVASRAD